MSFSVSLLAAALVLSIVVGISLGLLGGGGSILTVPILVYVLELPAHQAIATSLFVVGTTSLAALVPHARAGRVRVRVGAVFGAASMVGAYAAGRVAPMIPGAVLLLLFGGMMVVVAIAMMRKGKKNESNNENENDNDNESEVESAATPKQLPLIKIALEGLVVGAFTGLVGAGGGFLVVPALVLLGGLAMREAVGTSLMVIGMKSFAGFAGYAATVSVNWSLIAAITTAAVVGSVIGSSLVAKVSQALLRKGFAWFVLVMAAFILAQEIPRLLGRSNSLSSNWPWVLLAISVPLVAAVSSLAAELRRPRTAG